MSEIKEITIEDVITTTKKNNRKQEITQDSEMEVKIHFAVFLCGYRIIFFSMSFYAT